MLTMLTLFELTVSVLIGFAIGFGCGVRCCARPHHMPNEAVSLKVTEGKDEY